MTTIANDLEDCPPQDNETIPLATFPLALERAPVGDNSSSQQSLR